MSAALKTYSASSTANGYVATMLLMALSIADDETFPHGLPDRAPESRHLRPGWTPSAVHGGLGREFARASRLLAKTRRVTRGDGPDWPYKPTWSHVNSFSWRVLEKPRWRRARHSLGGTVNIATLKPFVAGPRDATILKGGRRVPREPPTKAKRGKPDHLPCNHRYAL